MIFAGTAAQKIVSNKAQMISLLVIIGLGLAGFLDISPLFAGTPPAPELARRLGCFACHNDSPGHLAAPLDGAGSRLSRQQLEIALTQPRKLHPGVRMPSYAYLPAGEQQALIEYLASLK